MNQPLVWQFQQALSEVVNRPEFGELNMAEVVGALEFAKYSVINVTPDVDDIEPAGGDNL